VWSCVAIEQLAPFKLSEGDNPKLAPVTVMCVEPVLGVTLAITGGSYENNTVFEGHTPQTAWTGTCTPSPAGTTTMSCVLENELNLASVAPTRTPHVGKKTPVRVSAAPPDVTPPLHEMF
jgi:hypothetical protein